MVNQRSKNDEKVWKPTPLGACTLARSNNKKAMHAVTECYKCDETVADILVELEILIVMGRAQLDRLDPKSKEAKLVEQHLSKLVMHYERLLRISLTKK